MDGITYMKIKIQKNMFLEIKFMPLNNSAYMYYWFKIKTNKKF